MEFLAFPNPSSFFQLLPRRPPIMAFLSHVLHLSNVLKRSPLVFKDDAPLPACPPRGPINITERGVGKRSATNHEMSDSGHVIEHYVEDRQIFALWDSEEMNLRSQSILLHGYAKTKDRLSLQNLLGLDKSVFLCCQQQNVTVRDSQINNKHQHKEVLLLLHDLQ